MGSARQADDALRELLLQRTPDASGAGATVGHLLDEWLAECERMELSPTTLRTYRSQIDRTLRPRMGRLPLVSFGPKHLDDLYVGHARRASGPESIRYA